MALHMCAAAKIICCYLYFVGLKLQGATCKDNTLSLSATILTELPLSSLQWVR